MTSWFEAYHKNIFLLFLAIFIVGILGNVTIIAYYIIKVYRNRTRRVSSAYHFLTVQLAVVDLCLCVCVPIARYVSAYIVNSDPLSMIPTHVNMSLSTASCWVLVMLSYERYRTIVNPFKRALKKSFICVICSMIWMTSALVYLPIHIVVSEAKRDLKCATAIYSAVLTVGTAFDCIFSSIGIGFFYFRISSTLRNRNQIVRDGFNGVGSSTSKISDSINNHHRCRDNKRNEYASKILLKLCIVYVCCVWPGRHYPIFRSMIIISSMLLQLQLFPMFLQCGSI